MTTPVSFELAKVLKEKGFDEPCNYYYELEYAHLYPNKRVCLWDRLLETKFKNSYQKLEKAAAPTIAEVVMWLYEKHGIWVQAMIYRRNPNDFIGGVYYGQLENYFTKPYNTPTETYEAAIEYVLNNLI